MSIDRTADGNPSYPRLPSAGRPRLVDSAWRDADAFDGGWIVSAAPARRQPLEPGRTVAERYLVRRVLGEGGMGQVLEVEHVALGRAFALKVLRLERWNDELVRRFNREARALARLSTPRVAQVTDFGVDGDAGPFYVMELLEGETLEDRVQRDGHVEPREALTICAELCDALSEVHAAGIVHRDLKPSNVGLPRSGPVGVKLLDFGLAAAMDDAFLSKITQSHQILGSLPYMAPEQFNSAEPAPAMDVYAVGVVLYEALTGRLPFFAPSTAAMIHQILAAPPPALPEGMQGRDLLEPLLERLLAKEPRERFASAAAAAQALRGAAGALGPARKAAHPPTRVASDAALPATQEARAVDSIAYLPTMAMPESGPIAESGTRLSRSAVEPIPPSSGSAPPSVPPPNAAITAPGFGAPISAPSITVPPAARPASKWPLMLALLGRIGVLLAVAAAVAVVIVLRVVDDGARDVSASEPPPPPRTAEPAIAPIAPVIAGAPHVAEPAQTEEEPAVAAQPVAPPAVEQHRQPAEDDDERAHAPAHHEEPERAPEPVVRIVRAPPRVEEPPPRPIQPVHPVGQPLMQPAPPNPPPRQPGNGIVRTW